ncbi:ATP-binding protein [Streptosporangium sp. NPDC051023]|uniref:ATP-binding protein n=1 Tax=Streptosporangium sp. NPDC051023 TaxID=3155410 RepID=UPI00344F5D37
MASGADLIKVGILKLPRDDRAPGLVRREMRRWLGAEHPGLSRLILAASELVTNAVRHADPGQGRNWVITALHEGPGFLRLAVTDPGSAFSIPHQVSVASVTETWSGREGGRGLFIVNRLSGGRWGTHTAPGTRHRVVWCHLSPTPVEDKDPSGMPSAPRGTGPAQAPPSPRGASARLAVPEPRRPR